MNAATIATIAALISSIMALISWRYNRELTKAAISMIDVKINGERPERNRLKINFLFLFKNVGKETLRIRELSLGHVDFGSKVFEIVSKKLILNPIHSEAIFNYATSFLLEIDPTISNETIGNVLPRVIGKHALILKLTYNGTSIFSKRINEVKYYLIYEGYGAVSQMSEEEYKEIETVLPNEFRR